MSSSAPIVEVQSLSFRYQSQKPLLLSGIDLSVRAGEKIGIWGDNGSGKSTLLKLILGYLKPSTKASVINWNGFPLKKNMPLPSLGYVGDPGHSETELGLPLGMAVQDLIDANRILHGEDNLEPIGIEMAELLKVSRLGDRSVDQLSAGERKRLMFVMALSTRRTLLILDEPTEGLDYRIVDQALGLLKSYLRKSQCALILVSHRQDEVAFLTDRVYFLEEGQLSMQDQKKFGFAYGNQSQMQPHSSGEILWAMRGILKAQIEHRINFVIEPLASGEN